MAATVTADKSKDLEDKNTAKPNPDKVIENRVKVRALEQVGGKPTGYYKTSVSKVGPSSFRVNIYTQEDAGESGFMKLTKIAHSLYLTLGPDDMLP